jgi:hypothetical protein
MGNGSITTYQVLLYGQPLIMIDLSPYKSGPDQQLGYQPVAVGWLQRNKTFPTGKSSVEFQEKLLAFCFEEHTVNQGRVASRCAVGENCPRVIPPVATDGWTAHFGSSEVRVIGEPVGKSLKFNAQGGAACYNRLYESHFSG